MFWSICLCISKPNSLFGPSRSLTPTYKQKQVYEKLAIATTRAASKKPKEQAPIYKLKDVMQAIGALTARLDR